MPSSSTAAFGFDGGDVVARLDDGDSAFKLSGPTGAIGFDVGTEG